MEPNAENLPPPSRPASDRRENRSHQRVRCDGTVELRRIPPAPPESIRGMVVNISEGGCLLKTERLLETGERLAMEMRLDDLVLRFIAEVRSVKSDPLCWAGLEFVGMSAGGLANLKTLIQVCASEQAPAPEAAVET